MKILFNYLTNFFNLFINLKIKSYNQQNLLSNQELFKLPYIIGMTASPAKFSKVNITPEQLKEKLESLYF